MTPPPDSSGPKSDAVGADALLDQWRERVLHRVTLVVVPLLATVSGGVFAYQHWQNGVPLAAVGGCLLVAAVWLAARATRISPQTRWRMTLTTSYTAGFLSLATLGISAEGMLGLFGFVSITAIMMGGRQARGALYLSACTVLLCALGFVLDLLPPIQEALVDPHDPLNWLRTMAFGTGILWVVGGGARLLLDELMRVLHDREALIERLREENGERELSAKRLAETQQRLLHAHQHEAVGRLAGGIAHDFNNTLTVILSYGELIKARLGPGNPVAELADQIIQAAEQGGDQTKQLLTFTRRQPVKPRSVDVQQILKSTERALQRLVPRTIRVHRVESREELFIKIDPVQLQQAVLNLAINARDAMPEGGDLYIEVDGCLLEVGDQRAAMPGPFVRVRVRDTGTGMTDEVRARMFEPFFTTKEPGLGTGLGLPNVRETTEGAGGFIEVKTSEGVGSELSLYFPRTEARSSGIEAARPATRPERATVLVVDDEPQIRNVVSTMLRDRGFNVQAADGAKSALAALKAGPVDLVCTDLVMPDMSGAKLIEEMKRSCARTPIIVCSAYGIDDEVSRRVQRGDVLFLAKPFTSTELLELVNKALSLPKSQPVTA